MNNNFDTALTLTLKFEGGYSNNPDDHGGATNYGVTQATYDYFRKGLQPRNVEFISPDEVKEIYQDLYWQPAFCNALPDGVDALHFDTAVNCGVYRAARILQECLGVAIDGIIGEKTLAAAAAADPVKLTNDYVQKRIDFYNAIVMHNPSQNVFLAGWINRAKAFLK